MRHTLCARLSSQLNNSSKEFKCLGLSDWSAWRHGSTIFFIVLVMRRGDSLLLERCFSLLALFMEYGFGFSRWWTHRTKKITTKIQSKNMSIRFNNDPFSEPAGPSREWVFSVFLYKNLQPISLTVTVNARYIEISYDFGMYKHTIKMNSNGYAEEKVWRSGKLLNHEKTSTQPNFAHATGPLSKLPFLKSYFVAGAGNGFLGMGITREERFQDVYIKVMLYERRFCFQIVQQQIDLEILTVSIDPSSFAIDCEGSHMGQIIKGHVGQVKRRISPPVLKVPSDETRARPIINKVRQENTTIKPVVLPVTKPHAPSPQPTLIQQPIQIVTFMERLELERREVVFKKLLHKFLGFVVLLILVGTIIYILFS